MTLESAIQVKGFGDDFAGRNFSFIILAVGFPVIIVRD